MRSERDQISILPRKRSGLIACAAGLTLALMAGAAGQQVEPQPPESPPPARTEGAGPFAPIQRFFEDGANNFRTHMQGAKTRMDEFGENAAATQRTMNERAAEFGKGAAEAGKGAAEFGKGAAEAGKNAAEATKSAMEQVAKLPTARVVQGRERCELAANGAPDCQAAADALCKRQGFNSGKSMDFTSAEQCPTRVWMSGRQSQPGECTTLTFISRAMCQ